MTSHQYKIEVQEDHLERLANAKPVQAVSELVWNGLDADATKVEISIEESTLGLGTIFVRDNGHGIPASEAPELFRRLGGSWKAHGNRSKIKNRMLHGKEGKGRFKALALGRVTDWTVTYDKEGSLFRYTITLIRDNLIEVRISDEEQVSGTVPGVEVRITELHKEFRSLNGDFAVQELSEIFALYLSDYSDTTISFRGIKLDPSKSIASRATINLEPIVEDDNEFAIEVELIEWVSATERYFYLCGLNGFPLQRIQPRFHAPGHQFSAYLKSDYISGLHERGVLDLAEMNTLLQGACDQAQERIKDYFRHKELESARSEIDEWKADRIYPYAEEPLGSVEAAERKVFDIVALNVKRHLPDFSESNRQTKAFQLRMLRQAIEKGPEELQHILTEVLELPDRKQRELSKLLEEASLANVISASRLVADRLKFIHGLEALLFDADLKKHLKERSQLHKMLADNNTWVFGEQFSLTVDDQSLTEVLRKHRKLIGKDTVIDKPVTQVDGKRGIVDLMLSRSVPRNHSDEREHLVVELKRPTVSVGMEEISQVKKYAFAVADDERFESLDTRWNFWVISNKLDKAAKREARQTNRPRGQVYQDGSIEVWCKTWSEILEECKVRLHFVQEKLQANVDKESSLKYLKKTYDKYLSGVSETDDETKDEEDSEATLDTAKNAES